MVSTCSGLPYHRDILCIITRRMGYMYTLISQFDHRGLNCPTISHNVLYIPKYFEMAFLIIPSRSRKESFINFSRLTPMRFFLPDRRSIIPLWARTFAPIRKSQHIIIASGIFDIVQNQSDDYIATLSGPPKKGSPWYTCPILLLWDRTGRSPREWTDRPLFVIFPYRAIISRCEKVRRQTAEVGLVANGI
jgi:hypothetical protein